MTAAVTDMTDCPSAETLAAFVDGRLVGAERDAVVAHAATCAECRDVILMATELAVDEGKVVRPQFGKRVIAPLLAAAAIVAAVFIAMPSLRERVVGGGAMQEAAEIESQFEKRQTKGRLTLGTTYKSYEGPKRGAGDRPDPGEARSNQVMTAEWKARELAERRRTAKNLHAAGLLFLVAGERDDAIKYLSLAKAADPSASVLNDLAAAHLERGRDEDYAVALAYANDALQRERTPIGLWNRALALERLGRTTEAIDAWKEYRLTDPNSPWAAEAKGYLTQLEEDAAWQSKQGTTGASTQPHSESPQPSSAR
jgi:tetratricopeptide (TPR) repeat protein